MMRSARGAQRLISRRFSAAQPYRSAHSRPALAKAHVPSGGARGALCLAVAAAGAAVVISRDERPPAECLGSSANHVLYVTGFPSVGDSTTNQKPLGTPQEISLPGGPGSIDSVALGPDWVVVAKKGTVYVSEGPGSEPVTLKASSGWFFSPNKVVEVACTRDTIYGRTASGAVMYWHVRRPTEGGPLVFEGPCYFSELRARKVSQMAAGPDHAVFVTWRGLALGLGQNDTGMVGTGATTGRVKVPTLIKIPKDRKIVRVACGGSHTLLLDSEGAVYSCGSDQWFQLGHGETWSATSTRDQAFVREPVHVRDLDKHPVGSIAAGGSHSLFGLAYDGTRVTKGPLNAKVVTPARVQEVWATGFGQYGQLGDRAYVHLSTLRPVKDLRVLAPVEDKLPPPLVACGENHSVVLTTEPVEPPQEQEGRLVGPVRYERKAYVFGRAYLSGMHVAKPTPLPVLTPSLVDAVYAGFDRSAFVQRAPPGGPQP